MSSRQLALKLASVFFAAGTCILSHAQPLNEVQVLKAHNSYHVSPHPALQGLAQFSEVIGQVLHDNNYTHPPIPTLLDDFGVRGLELDVWQDDEGGRWSFRAAAGLLGLDDAQDDSPEMQQPGMKVFHLDSIDYGTTCKTLVKCLSQIATWSDATPGHFPIILKLEIQTRAVIQIVEAADPERAAQLRDLVRATTGKEMPIATPLSRGTVQQLLDTTVEVLGWDRLVTPDSVRQEEPSLRAALLEPGHKWPDVDGLRGKVLVQLTNGVQFLTQIYGDDLAGSPAFPRKLIGEADLARGAELDDNVVFVELDMQGDPLPSPLDIGSLVNSNLWVTARADKGGLEASNMDYRPLHAAVLAGAQMIMTDFVEQASTGYQARLPCADDATRPDHCNRSDAALLGTEDPPSIDGNGAPSVVGHEGPGAAGDTLGNDAPDAQQQRYDAGGGNSDEGGQASSAPSQSGFPCLAMLLATLLAAAMHSLLSSTV